MKKIFCFILLLGLLLSLGACGPKIGNSEVMSGSSELPDLPFGNGGEVTNQETLFVSDVDRIDSTIVAHGDYIYIGTLSDGLYKYNRKTGKGSSACVDPACDGSCIVENLRRILYLSDIVNNELYFTANGYIGRDAVLVYAKINLITGEVTEILRLYLDHGDAEFDQPIVGDGYMYYLREVLKEGGNEENPEDYESYYYRISLDGGEPERFCPQRTDEVHCVIFFAADGKLYMYRNYQFIEHDPETGEERVFLETTDFCKARAYLDGKIYYYQKDDQATEEGTKRDTLCRVDVKTGKVEQLVDGYIYTFHVTDEGIYYTLWEERVVYDPDNSHEDPDIAYHGAALYRCDHDGSNAEIVYENPYMYISYDYTVVDGILYGYVSEYVVDERSHGWRGRGICAFDLSTGTYTPCHTPKEENPV